MTIPSADMAHPAKLILPRLGLGISGPLGTPLTSARQVQELVQATLAAATEADPALTATGFAKIAYFNTAPFYGLAQRRLGRALRGVPREAFVVSTKIGSRRQGWRMVKDWHPDSVARTMRRSLDQLGITYVDILFLHGCPAPDEVAGLQAALARMHKAGWYRHLGLCARWQDRIDETLKAFPISAIMVPVRWHDAARMQRLEDWSNQDYRLIAIEILGSRADALRAIRQPADLWYLARALLRRLRRSRLRAPRADPPDEPILSPSDALIRVLAMQAISTVLTTTTRLAHWRNNLALTRIRHKDHADRD